MKTAASLFVSFFIFLFSFESKSQITSWTALTSGTTQHLSSVSAPSKDTVYVCGDSGTILKTINGGITWTAQTNGTTNNFISMSFYDNNNGYIVDDFASIITTTDGGATWFNMFGITDGFKYIYFYDSSFGIAAGADDGLIFKIDNTMSTIVPAPTDSSNQFNCIFFTSPMIGYVSGVGGLILKSINGGASWLPQTSGVTSSLNAIHFQNTTSGIAVGDTGVIVKTTNSGGTWASVTSGTTDILTGIDFIDTLHGFIVGGNISSNIGSILETTNGGSTWTTSFPSTSRLTRVDLVNPNIGYAVGLDGTILKYTSNVGILENENTSVSLNIFPNPFTTSTTIDLSKYQFKNKGHLSVFDIAGKLIKNIEIRSNTTVSIDRNGMESGIYIAKLYDGTVLLGESKIIVK